MSQPFSFPPPPPPPPSKRDNPPPTSNSRGGFRGRGGSRGNFSRGASQVHRGRGSHNFSQPRRDQYTSTPSVSTNVAKRDYSTAFLAQPQTKPKAPPAVPSFDVDIKSLLHPKKESDPVSSTKRKSNLLGLTPGNEAVSSSEDDADDESKLVIQDFANGLQFEHKGRQLSLRTPAEIAAWIAERKKRFPTQAKAEAAKKEAEERKKQWDERKRIRDEEFKTQKEMRQKERNERERQRLKEKLIAVQLAKAKSAVAESKDDPATKAKQKADKLRKRAEKAARELRLMEEELLRLEEKQPGIVGRESNESADTINRKNDAESLSPSDTDETSSSGSSVSETVSGSDSEPEEATSKRVEPDRIAPTKQMTSQASTEGTSLCKNMTKFGRCKFGKKCRYSHKIQREKPAKSGATSGKRPSLYQVMVEKEKEQELQHALRVIIALGKQGLLDEPEQQNKNIPPQENAGPSATSLTSPGSYAA